MVDAAILHRKPATYLYLSCPPEVQQEGCPDIIYIIHAEPFAQRKDCVEILALIAATKFQLLQAAQREASTVKQNIGTAAVDFSSTSDVA